MIKTIFLHDLRKVCALLAATLLLPALAHAKDIQWAKWDKDPQGEKWDKGDKWDKDDKGEKGGRGEKSRKGDPAVSSVPEANTAWVLIPFMGAVLLFSGRHLIRRKATQ